MTHLSPLAALLLLALLLLALLLLVACEDQGVSSDPGPETPPPATGTSGDPGTAAPDAAPDGEPAAGLVGDGAAAPRFPTISEPIPADKSAWDLAGKKKLEKVEPGNYPGLLNVFRLSENIISGSEPHGEAALKRIADMGVLTILSVDGKAPDAAAAKKLGMRYVHVPIQYRGITESERLKIAKVFLELDGPFYVHCFHGRHRGAAAAAWGRVVLDGVPRREALAEMRQWCGTSDKYRGLYRSVGKSTAPTEADLKALSFDFPAKHEFKGFRSIMVEVSRAFDHLKALRKRNWKGDPEHPDLTAANEARRLVRAFSNAGGLPEVTSKPEEFRKWTAKSLEWSEKLVKRLDKVAAGDKSARDTADAAFRDVAERCDRCHKKYRNRRREK